MGTGHPGVRVLGHGPQAKAALCSFQVPVAHCFGPRGLYKRKFCGVCRKGLEAPGLRCEGTTRSLPGPLGSEPCPTPHPPAPNRDQVFAAQGGPALPAIWGGGRRICGF